MATSDQISLRRAILRGDLESVKKVGDTNPEALSASITESEDTPLMIAMSGQRFELIVYLLGLPPVVKNLASQNKEGNTALHEATIVGNVRAAKLLVDRNRYLLRIRNIYGQQPLHTAAAYCQEEILHYCLETKWQFNEDVDYKGTLHLAIDARLFDVARSLLRRVPRLKSQRWEMAYPLERIARMPNAFRSGTNLNIWQRFIYNWAPLASQRFQDNQNDVENPATSSQAWWHRFFSRVCFLFGAPLDSQRFQDNQNDVENPATSSQAWWHRFFSRVCFLSGAPSDSNKFQDTRNDVENVENPAESSQAPTICNVENPAESSQAPTIRNDVENVENPAESSQASHSQAELHSQAESSQASQAQAESSQASTIFCWHRFFTKDYFLPVWRKLAIDVWKLFEIIVPHVKNIRETKLIHHQALSLVTHLCPENPNHIMEYGRPREAAQMMQIPREDREFLEMLKNSLLKAAETGILELVSKILLSFSYEISPEDEVELSALQVAVLYRRKNVFNYIIQQKGVRINELLLRKDIYKNNILHLVGQMPRRTHLEIVTGAVLQMQDELQWYKGVEKLVSAQAREEMNLVFKTPMMVFDETHCQMMQSEQKWIVSMAGACTVATTIIGTIAFAAAVQAPGGNNGEGHSVLYTEAAFKVFATSNALALYSAISTLLIILSIYTARYAAIDFLYALPNRLIIGMIALFLSVTSTLVAFGSALSLMFSQERKYKILTPVIILSCVPVILFTLLQFPILLNMMKTTYGRSMFSPLDERKIRGSYNTTR